MAREIGSRAAPGQKGFSSQSFKVGAVSELSATVAGPSDVAAFTGHKTTSALMHYKRKRINCKVPTLMEVSAEERASYTREDATLEWASSSVNVPSQQGNIKKGRPRKAATRAGTPRGAPIGAQGDAGGRHTIHAASQPAPPTGPGDCTDGDPSHTHPPVGTRGGQEHP
jgi:hypothetical protein